MEQWIQKKVRPTSSHTYEAYQIAGPYGEGGTSKKGTYAYIKASSNGKSITVPEYIWKIVLFLEKGENDLERITKDTPVIAVLMPNDEYYEDQIWSNYIVSIDELEKLTGYDFLSNLEDEVEEALESRKGTIFFDRKKKS